MRLSRRDVTPATHWLAYTPAELEEWVTTWLPTVPAPQRVSRLDSAIRLRLLTDEQVQRIRRAMVRLTIPPQGAVK